MPDHLPWSVFELIGDETCLRRLHGPDCPVEARTGVALGEWLTRGGRGAAAWRSDEIGPGAPYGWQTVFLRAEHASYALVRPARSASEDLGELAGSYTVLERGSDAVIFCDVAASLLAASPAWLEIYGYSLREVLGRNPRIINSRRHPPTLYQEMWKGLTDRTTGTWSGILENRRASGEIVRVWQTIVTVRGCEGQIDGYFGATRDVSLLADVQGRLARENEELQRLNRLKSDLMSIAAHDLKSPLFALAGYADMLANDPQSAARMKAPLRIRDLAHNMERLVRNILDLQDAEAGRLSLKRRRMNPWAALRAAAELQEMNATTRKVRIEVDLRGPALPAFLDGTKFDQALSNLLSNAVKFCRAGGVVRLSAGIVPETGLVVTVDDQGPGLPAEVLDLLRRPWGDADSGGFRRTGGTGWGLVVARQTAGLHGGRLHAENRDSGARLALELPLGYEELGRELHTALACDPNGSLGATLDPVLAVAGVEFAMVQRPKEFQDVAAKEYPDLLIVEENLTALFDCVDIRAPDTGATLRPARAVCRLTPHGPVLVHIDGPDTVRDAFARLLEAARPNLNPLARTVSA